MENKAYAIWEDSFDANWKDDVVYINKQLADFKVRELNKFSNDSFCKYEAREVIIEELTDKKGDHEGRVVILNKENAQEFAYEVIKNKLTEQELELLYNYWNEKLNKQ